VGAKEEEEEIVINAANPEDEARTQKRATNPHMPIDVKTDSQE
jgi:hypothetical protein